MFVHAECVYKVCVYVHGVCMCTVCVCMCVHGVCVYVSVSVCTVCVCVNGVWECALGGGVK